MTVDEEILARIRTVMKPNNGRTCDHRHKFHPTCCQCMYELGRQELAAKLLGIDVGELRRRLR